MARRKPLKPPLLSLPIELPDIFPESLSEKQTDVITAVRDLTAETGQPPSATAVAERLGVARITAREALMRLEKMGMLRDVPKMVSSGTWKVTPTGQRYLPADEPASPASGARGEPDAPASPVPSARE